MTKIKATKRRATDIAQFGSHFGLRIAGEWSLRKEKKKRMIPFHYDRYGIKYDEYILLLDCIFIFRIFVIVITVTLSRAII